ncbi:MAG: Hsp33 family molecular chaperone HslO [Burkholderiaceae bacterium]|jgi:molecular chaperone Hsp33|nr:Hsp33 family molecular chaperone HslO [Burkholderiaceae bacterium]
MSELHRFIFEGLPVRGQWVRLTDAWQDVLRRRAANTQTGAYPPPVAQLLGELTAAAVLLRAGIKFDGALTLQIQGDGPLKLAVAEVQADLRLRATATLQGAAPAGAGLPELVNAHGRGRCLVVLDPAHRRHGQPPQQGVAALTEEGGAPLPDVAGVIEHYMRQSEQLDTTLVLAADAQAAAGLLIQRLPDNGGQRAADEGAEDGYRRIALLAQTAQRAELLGLDGMALLRRLFWQEKLLLLASPPGTSAPRFTCPCSRERVAAMLQGLGRQEVEAILREQGVVEVGCDFCGRQERFDAVDAAGLLFTPAQALMGGTQTLQ